MNRPAIAVLLVLPLAGCFGPKAPEFVLAAGESRVQTAEAAGDIAWRGSVLEGEGRASAASLGTGDTTGLRVAAAAGDAIAAARKDLRSKAAILPMPDGTSLSRFMASRPDAGSRIDEMVALAPATHRYDAATNEAVAVARIEMEPVAAVVLAAVEASGAQKRTPDQEARERALRDARLKLRNQLLELPVGKKGMTTADQIRWDVVLEGEIARAIQEARIVRDEKTGLDLWNVELQADTKKILETAAREK